MTHRRLSCLAVIGGVAMTACAHTPAVGYGRSSCPISAQARPYSIRVTGDSSIGRSILQSVADALAGWWGSDDELPPAREMAIFASLNALIDKPPYHGFGEWRPEPGDTGVAHLIYRNRAPPEFRVASSGMRAEMQRRMTAAFDRAVAGAHLGVSDDVLPLTLPVDSLMLQVRFGWEPSPHRVDAESDGLAIFALNAEQARPRSGKRFVMYPEEMRQMNIEGEVRLAFVISADGSVDTTTVRTIESTAPEFLSEARRRIHGFRFYPAKLNCQPVPIVAIQPINWQLTR
jgi:TonB family protein